ncbi:pH-response regulator protein palH/RIM21 [Cyphellophora attinorum]|uniref:pH-response regulator protein palH/RIM21 n=1 Tax=Cyphellophora attinorum TaxID=1664694 RepID=A0A0N1H8D9_9EURO|nr:pH-response regulator protein palH/RIM21 [Phialophora attinorum]KPI38162.1 pH-response regulator protein palH/RIM21 [Phialophora attinorum]
MQPTPTLSARQLWGQINTRTSATGTREWCTPVILPTGGILVLGENISTRLAAQATYLLPCNSDESIISPDTTGNSTVLGFREPFYASISPQIFALATATVISYVLVILIFITPRTFYVGGPGGGGGFLSRHGLSTSTSVVGVGRRPLLQKVATIGVATSLTIAAADTFHVAQEQYYQGYLDSSALVEDVVNTVLIRVVRIISDSFIWLAQVQTLIRLFPRHKEKVTIKWLGFALVSADIIFSILDSFISDSPGTRPRSFTDAIPALNYLFELAISLIYASCVIYYSLSKRRFAFWHPKMRNICLVALMSLMSVLIPVVFFVLDISLPKIAGWGEYIRWVGAAAASVVVWEWVERIEALERDERKDGILGREIFDGDDMLDRPSSDDSDYHRRRRGKGDGGDLEKAAGIMSQIRHVRNKLPVRRRRKRPVGHDSNSSQGPPTGGTDTTTGVRLVPPKPAASPPDRSDTASAASTVYAVRYHNLTSPSPTAPETVPEQPEPPADPVQLPKDISDSSTEDHPPIVKEVEPSAIKTTQQARKPQQFWSTVPNPFKRRRAEPPAEVAGAQIASGQRRSPIDQTLNLKNRLGAFAIAQRDRFGRNGSGPSPPLPIMVIPAPKGRTWSPEEIRNSSSISAASQALVQHDEDGQAGPSGHSRQPSSATSTSVSSNNVVIIPAPRRGQTWSPPQASSSSQSRTPTQQRQQQHSNAPTPQQQDRQSPPVAGSPVPSLQPGPSSLRGAFAEQGAIEGSPRSSPQSRVRRSPVSRRNTQPRRTPPAQVQQATRAVATASPSAQDRPPETPGNAAVIIPAPSTSPPSATPVISGGSRTATRDFFVQQGEAGKKVATPDLAPSVPPVVPATSPPSLAAQRENAAQQERGGPSDGPGPAIDAGAPAAHGSPEGTTGRS